jgi:hypothetical protein
VTRVVIARWAGWAPGVEGDADWRAWAAAPRPLLGDGQPDAKVLPLHVRRRCDLLSRMMLRAAHTCVPDAHERARLRTVFASRYGSFNATVRMMEGLARNEPLSPSLFMQSVHNAQSGLFSIWSKNTAASTAIAGRGDTFACGFVEALCQLHEGGGPILLLTGDEALPPPVAHLSPRRGWRCDRLRDRSGGRRRRGLPATPGAGVPRLPPRRRAGSRSAPPATLMDVV